MGAYGEKPDWLLIFASMIAGELLLLRLLHVPENGYAWSF